jgi:hypothetical protein
MAALKRQKRRKQKGSAAQFARSVVGGCKDTNTANQSVCTGRYPGSMTVEKPWFANKQIADSIPSD